MVVKNNTVGGTTKNVVVGLFSLANSCCASAWLRMIVVLHPTTLRGAKVQKLAKYSRVAYINNYIYWD